jgi:hypothetical protein
MNFLKTDQCVEQCIGAFLHFVHDDALWAFAPDKVMRWHPAKWPRDPDSDLWKPLPFVWDFGSQVIIPELWVDWLSEITRVRHARRSPDPMYFDRVGTIKEPAELVFRCHIDPGERKIFTVRPKEIFRGENLVFDVNGADWIYLWDVKVGHLSQMKRGKDSLGNDMPWPATAFQEQEVPFNLRFDTCVPEQDMSIEVESRYSLPFDFEVLIPGTQLVKKTS